MNWVTSINKFDDETEHFTENEIEQRITGRNKKVCNILMR